MKFNDAWEKALNMMPAESRPRGKGIQDARLLTVIWNIMVIAQEKGLDDIAYIDNYNRIMSIPLQKKPAKEAAENNTVVKKADENGKKEQKKKTTKKSTAKKSRAKTSKK